MNCPRHFAFLVTLFALTAYLASPTAIAAPLAIKGASFDAPASCQATNAALVCKADGQQFELYVNRKPLAPQIMPTEPFARKMVYFNDVHDTAVGNILRSTANDKATQFSSYGAYSALGTAMPGTGVPTSPSVRFASVLHDEEIWEFLEVTRARTPAVDELSAALQRSLVLPPVVAVPSSVPKPSTPPITLNASTTHRAAPPLPTTPSVASASPAESAPAVTPKSGSTPPPARTRAPTPASFSGPLMSLQYPDFLEPVVVENTIDHFAVNFKHKTRAAGPHLSVNLYSPKDKPTTAATVANARKDVQTAMMSGSGGSLAVTTLGAIKGVGFALIGVPDPAKALSGVESIETTFAADVPSGVLEVRLTSTSEFSVDAEAVWAMLATSIVLSK